MGEYGVVIFPNYDLHCTKCSSEHNIRATMTEKVEKQIFCPDCGSFEMETIFKIPPAFVKNAGMGQCPQRGGCGERCPHSE